MKTCLSVSQSIVFFKIPKILSTSKNDIIQGKLCALSFLVMWSVVLFSGRDRGGVKSDDCPISGESQRHGGPWSSYCLCLLIFFLSTWLIKLSIVNKHLQAVPYLCIYTYHKVKTIQQFQCSLQGNLMLRRFKLVPLISFFYSYSISNHKKIG